MNFTRFPANATNIFPIANSKTGGQLLTEFKASAFDRGNSIAADPERFCKSSLSELILFSQFLNIQDDIPFTQFDCIVSLLPVFVYLIIRLSPCGFLQKIRNIQDHLHVEASVLLKIQISAFLRAECDRQGSIVFRHSFWGGHGTDSKDIQPLVENPCKCYLRNRTVFLFRELLTAGKPFIVVSAAISAQRNIVQMFLRVIGACKSS